MSHLRNAVLASRPRLVTCQTRDRIKATRVRLVYRLSATPFRMPHMSPPSMRWAIVAVRTWSR